VVFFALRTVRMDSHTHSAFGRLEVVETGRRRRWSEDEKARIVLESLAGPRLVSATARRHGISRAQLLAWRRTLRPERSEAEPVPGFLPAVIAREPAPVVTPKVGRRAKSGDDRIEIVLGRVRRLIVGAGFDAAALARVLDLLERR
jgi:transposase